MAAQIHPFIHLLFISIIALFPVVNPVGSAFIISPYLAPLSDTEKKAAAQKIAFYSFSICIITLFIGHWILELFGISIPVIQLAGGIMICKMGWESLSSTSKKDNSQGHAEVSQPENKGNIHAMDNLFYPLTFPITTGAGTISVLFTLSAHSATNNWKQYASNTLAIILAILAMCLLIFVFYGNTERMIKKLGTTGETVVNKTTAFLIFCVGIQIAVTGIKNLLHSGVIQG